MTATSLDPLAKLPTWRLVCILGGCVLWLGSAGYGVAAIFFDLPRLPAIAGIVVGTVVVAALMPLNGWFLRR